MRHFDLSPLYRSTIGFDRLFSMLDQPTGGDQGAGYPPYNIERIGENDYRISIAVAGFSDEELTVEVKEASVTVRGEKKPADPERKSEFLHQGIAGRAFERRFQLADHVRVTGAKLEHGLLHVDLTREVPESVKPRRIPITNGKATMIEARAA